MLFTYMHAVGKAIERPHKGTAFFFSYLQLWFRHCVARMASSTCMFINLIPIALYQAQNALIMNTSGVFSKK